MVDGGPVIPLGDLGSPSCNRRESPLRQVTGSDHAPRSRVRLARCRPDASAMVLVNYIRATTWARSSAILRRIRRFVSGAMVPAA